MVANIALGVKIRSYRGLKGYSQENMADLLGISPTAYAKIERGETDVNFSRIEQIANVLQTNVYELITLGEKTLVYFSNGDNSNNINSYGTNDQQIAIELEKKKIENEALRQEIEHLKKIIRLLEKEPA